MSEKKRQLDRVKEILERDGQIDNFAAIHDRLTLRLGARIWDLRDAGWVITTERQPDKNTVYKVVSRPKAEQMSMAV